MSSQQPILHHSSQLLLGERLTGSMRLGLDARNRVIGMQVELRGICKALPLVDVHFATEVLVEPRVPSLHARFTASALCRPLHTGHTGSLRCPGHSA